MEPQDPNTPTNAPAPTGGVPGESAPLGTAFGAAPRVEPKLTDEERRAQQLEQNDLAKLLVKGKEKLGGGIGSLVAIGLGVLLLIFLATLLFDGGKAAQTEAWSDYLEARGPDGFEAVAEEHANSVPAAFAQVAAARDRLNSGIRRSFTDGVTAEEDLQKARDLFEAVLNRGDLPIELELQAQQGLAIALESLSDGSDESIQAAIDAYRPLAASSMARFNGLAKARIEALENGGAKEFYAWLASQDRSPAARPEPRDQLTTPDQILNGALPDDTLPEMLTGDADDADPTGVQGDSRTMLERSTEPPADDSRTDDDSKVEMPQLSSEQGEENAEGQNPDPAPISDDADSPVLNEVE